MHAAVRLALTSALLTECGLCLAPDPPQPPQAEIARATQVLAAFLDVPVDRLHPGMVRALTRGLEGEPSLWLEGWRVPADGGGNERLTAEVVADQWSVAYASWPDRDPGDEPPPAAVFAGESRMRAVAASFARQHFPRWSGRMRLEEFHKSRGPTSGPGTEYSIVWREKLDDWYTGSFVSVSVTAWGRPEILRYSARIAPAHRPREVKVPRERAIGIGTWIAAQLAGEPVTPFRVEGWLSNSMVPGRGPMWIIYFETKRQVEGRPAGRCCIFIDAVTGADVTWAGRPDGAPPDWPKPEDMPPELRPTPQEPSPPSAERPQ